MNDERLKRTNDDDSIVIFCSNLFEKFDFLIENCLLECENCPLKIKFQFIRKGLIYIWLREDQDSEFRIQEQNKTTLNDTIL